MDKKQLFSLLKVFLKIGFTALLMYLVFRKIDFVEVKNIFLESNPVYIFLAFITYFLAQIVASWRLLSFLKGINLHLKFGFNFKLYLLGLFYNVFLPGGIGGDGYKIYLLKKRYKLPTKRVFLALFFDRLSGLWAIGFICVTLILLIPKIEVPANYAIAALLIGTFVYYMVMRKFFTDYAKNFALTHLKACITQSLQLGCVIFILLSQDFSGKFSPYLFSFLVSSLATIIPISVGGFGIREYVMTHASDVFNMDQNLAVFVTITFTLLSTIASLPGIYFVYRSKEFEPLPHEQDLKKADLEELETNL